MTISLIGQKLAWLAKFLTIKPRGYTSLGVTSVPSMTGFFFFFLHDFGARTPSVCKVSTLLREPSPHLPRYHFYWCPQMPNINLDIPMLLPRKGGRGEEGGSREGEERGRGRRERRVVSQKDNFEFAQGRLYRT